MYRRDVTCQAQELPEKSFIVARIEHKRSRTSLTILLPPTRLVVQQSKDPMSRLAAPTVILILARLVTSSSSSIRTSAFQFVRASPLSSTSDSSPLPSRHRVVRWTTSPTSLLLLKMSSSSSSAPWKPGDTEQANEARALDIWPLDEYNAELLNAVHPRGYDKSVTEPHEVYDLIAIGAGAGGLVSSRQVSPKRKKTLEGRNVGDTTFGRMVSDTRPWFWFSRFGSPRA
jgi:hypothetical protein